MFLGSCAFGTSFPPLLACTRMVPVGFPDLLPMSQFSYVHPVILLTRECGKQKSSSFFQRHCPQDICKKGKYSKYLVAQALASQEQTSHSPEKIPEAREEVWEPWGPERRAVSPAWDSS